MLGRRVMPDAPFGSTGRPRRRLSTASATASWLLPRPRRVCVAVLVLHLLELRVRLDPAVDQHLHDLRASQLGADVVAPAVGVEVLVDRVAGARVGLDAVDLGLDLVVGDRDLLLVGDGAQDQQHLDALLGAFAVLLAQGGLVLLGHAQVVLVGDALLGHAHLELVDHDVDLALDQDLAAATSVALAVA